MYGRSARAAPPQSAVRRGTFDLGAIDLRGGWVVGADEARWEDEWDAKFFNLEGKQEVKRSQSGSFAAESSPGGPSLSAELEKSVLTDYEYNMRFGAPSIEDAADGVLLPFLAHARVKDSLRGLCVRWCAR
jgi:hypothetical protein